MSGDQSGARWDTSSAPEPRLPALARVVLYLLAFFLLQGVLGVVVIGALVATGMPFPQDDAALWQWLIGRPVLLAGTTWGTLAVAFGVTAFFVRVLDRRPVVSLGFEVRPAALAQCLVGFALGGALLATVFVVGWLLGWYRVVGVLPAGRVPVLVVAALAILIPAAAWEEIAMRGYVLQTLERRYGWRWALGLSAVVFALGHANNPNAGWPAVLGISVSGIYLGCAYLWTRRLWLPIAAHTAWNFFEGPVFGFPVSGIRMPAAILQTETSGPRLWTGGVFGPEAGLLLALAILVHLGVLAWATRPFRPAADGFIRR